MIIICYFNFFFYDSTFRQGMHDLRVWPKVLADPSPQSSTPGKARDANDQMTRLAKVRVYQFRQLWENPIIGEREREMFYLTMHSTHFIYGYMVSDIWLRTILIVRKETCCHHRGYSYRLTAMVLLYAPSQTG